MTGHLSLIHALIPAVLAAGEVELKYYHAGVEAEDKDDGSPVTKADREAEAIIMAALTTAAPHIPAVGEEGTAAGRVPDISGGTFFLVDPLDGTREFITGGGDFTVNIALLENFTPVMGIIYAPVSGALYYAAEGQAFAVENGVTRNIAARAAPGDGITAAASKRHGDPERLAAFLQGYKVKEVVSRSSSLKFCAIAMGAADLYPRLGPTSEWDTAAGEAILRMAGGQVTDLEGRPLVYGKAERKFLNPHFVARGA